jgi:translation initiation factor eIF-2B subunit delta
MTTPTEAAAAAAANNDQPKTAKKAPPPNLVLFAKKPPLTKAERRALQEQQRAAKAATGATASTTAVAASTTSSKDTTSASTKALVAGATAAPTAAAALKDSSDGFAASALHTPVAPSTKSTKSVLVSHLPLPHPEPAFIFDTGAASGGAASASAAAAAGAVTPSGGLWPLPAPVLALGRAYATGSIRGGHARCRAMLECLILLLDTKAATTPPLPQSASATTTTDVRTLVDALYWKPAFTFWTEHCRPHSIAMGNAYAFCKSAALCCGDRDVTWERLVPLLQETIYAYIRERLDFAVTAIAEIACTKLLQLSVPNHIPSTGPLPLHQHHNLHINAPADLVLLTYGYSEAVCAVLLQAVSTLRAAAAASATGHAATPTQRMRVICVDSPPLLEGRKLLNRLLQETSDNGQETAVLECCYIHLAAMAYVLPTVTKVLLGASALQSDGSVTGRIGTAVVALLAHHQNCPVLVCAETFKISNRSVQLESLAYNELLGRHDSGHAGQEDDLVERLELLYDLTPAAHVSGIVTELGIVPPSSIAVLLREMNQPTDWKR